MPSCHQLMADSWSLSPAYPTLCSQLNFTRERICHALNSWQWTSKTIHCLLKIKDAWLPFCVSGEIKMRLIYRCHQTTKSSLKNRWSNHKSWIGSNPTRRGNLQFLTIHVQSFKPKFYRACSDFSLSFFLEQQKILSSKSYLKSLAQYWILRFGSRRLQLDFLGSK